MDNKVAEKPNVVKLIELVDKAYKLLDMDVKWAVCYFPYNKNVGTFSKAIVN